LKDRGSGGERLEAEVLLRMAQGGLSLDEILAGAGIGREAAMDALASLQQKALVMRHGTRKASAYRLVEGPEAFKAVFLLCDRGDRGTELLRTEYAQGCIGPQTIHQATKELVFACILALLRLLTASNSEVREDNFLGDLSASLGQRSEAPLILGGISDSLEEVGFPEFLNFSLEGSAGEDAEAEKRDILRQMAQRDVELFFGRDPPLVSLAAAFEALLFPVVERRELLMVLSSSPSALRLVLIARETRSSSFISAALTQALPLLGHLFQLFARQDMADCSPETRRNRDEEVLEIVREGADVLPRPSPVLRVLHNRASADRSSGKLA